MQRSSPSPFPFHALVPRDDEGKPLQVRRKPGRPRKVVAPTIHELELAQLLNAERDLHVEADALVRAVEEGTRSSDILRALVRELAIESAALKLEIRSAQSASKWDGLPQKHSRRIDALTKIAAITLEAHKLGLLELDLYGPGTQRLFEFFVETVFMVADATLQSPDAFKNACRAGFAGWEARVDAADR